ncbi:MAG: hypothetical protein UHM85_07720 [Acutalibacteraceae bacterium]|nr:hypothetical protein [Acutalibacteraceae bacterium]
MKNLKKALSLVLCLVMLISVVPVFSATAATSGAYVPDYDTETPVIVLHGIGQNDTYVVDDEGNKTYDDAGDEITGWPLELDLMGALGGVIPKLLLSLFTRKDSGLSDALREAAPKLFYAIEKDNEGNYVNNIDVPCYFAPVSEIPEEKREMYFNRIPIQECAEIIGEDRLFFFGYDSLGDISETTKRLHKYVEFVCETTGSDKVNLCPISLGGSVAVSYLDMFKEDHSKINKIVYIVPAIDGSELVGDMITGNVSVFMSDDALYEDLMVNLMGDTWTTYLINMVLRILPSDVLKSALSGLLEGVVENVVVKSTQLWATCPTSYYEEARAKWLMDDKYASIREKVDTFMTARANFEENQNHIRSLGGQLYDIVTYDLPMMIPLTAEYKTSNTDCILHVESSSMGATVADLGKTLGEGYEAAGTYCNNPAHNHLSPDGMVDPTTGLLPCTTWYFKGQSHEMLQYNDICLKLGTQLMTDRNMVDVYSNPEAYPQFNGARITRYTNWKMEDWAEADKSGMTTEQIANVEAAIAEIKAMEQETVIDTEKWNAAEAALEQALIDAGVYTSSEPSVIEKAATVFFKAANKAINKVCEKLGY